MDTQPKYIVQYVGFKTKLSGDDFVNQWAPFATRFKNAGILTIDLYQVPTHHELNFLSRNVWTESTYFETFPSGIAGAGSGGGISVIQLGGYWLAAQHLTRQDKMILAFLTHDVETTDSSQIIRLRCSNQVPYQKMMELAPASKSNFSLQFTCTHLKQI